MKFHGLMQMREEVFRIVATRIEMKLVPNALGEQLLVQFTRALREAELILLAAIEVDGLGLDGDAIFAGSMGGPMVSYERLHANVKTKILKLADATVLMPGHGPLTTVGE